MEVYLAHYVHITIFNIDFFKTFIFYLIKESKFFWKALRLGNGIIGNW